MAGMATRSAGDIEPATDIANATWRISRRGAICSTVGVCVGAVAVGTGLAACGSGDSDSKGADDSAADDAGGPAPLQGASLAKLADVPVGGGVLVTGAGGLRVMLTQPSAGIVKAFDARCTHQRTIVAEPANGIMTCPNHGSRFKAADGAVVRGPATAPLDTIAVRVRGSEIVTA